jgi:hypothetical protein
MLCRPTEREGATRSSGLSSHDDGVSSLRVAIPACLERNAAGLPHSDLRQNVAARCCSFPPCAGCSIQRSPGDSVQFPTSAAQLSQCARIWVRRARGSDDVPWIVARFLCNVAELRAALGRIPHRARQCYGDWTTTVETRGPTAGAVRRRANRRRAIRPPIVEPAGRPLLAPLRCGPAISVGPRPQLSPARYRESHP